MTNPINYNEYKFIDCAILILDFLEEKKKKGEKTYIYELRELIKNTEFFPYIDDTDWADITIQKAELNQIVRASLASIKKISKLYFDINSINMDKVLIKDLSDNIIYEIYTTSQS